MGTPGLWFDWTGGGFGSGANDNCTDLVMNATYTRGGAPEITGAAQAGSATFIVKNPDGLFDPDNSAGPLYGQLVDGVPVWWGVNDDGTISDKGATVYGRFAGRITDISPLPVAGASGSTPTAEIVCEDALGWYARTPVALTDDCSSTAACLTTNPILGYFSPTPAAIAWTGLSFVGVSGHPTQTTFGTEAVITPAGSGTPGLPAGWASNDIFLLCVELFNDGAVSAPSGYAAVPGTPQGIGTPGAAASVQQYLFWRRATGSESAPTVAIPGAGGTAIIMGIRGCVTTGNPWSVTAGGTAPSSLSVSIAWPFGETGQLLMIVAAYATATQLYWYDNTACGTTLTQQGTWGGVGSPLPPEIGAAAVGGAT